MIALPTSPLTDRPFQTGWSFVRKSVWTLMLRVMSSLMSRMPLYELPIALSGCRSIRFCVVYASVPMLLWKYPHAIGEYVKPALAMMRFVFALILFLFTAKYGLSISEAAERLVMRVRVPAGVSQFAALFVSGHARRPMSGLLSPLYA